jgi:hypothetical protein
VETPERENEADLSKIDRCSWPIFASRKLFHKLFKQTATEHLFCALFGVAERREVKKSEENSNCSFSVGLADYVCCRAGDGCAD